MSRTLRAAARRALPLCSPWYWAAVRAHRRFRRAALIARVRWTAAMRSAVVELAIAPDASVGRRVHVEIDPDSRNRLTIDAGARIHDHVTIWLRGGVVELGREAVLRRRVEMNSSGELRLEAQALLSWGVVVHCARAVTVGERTIVGEYSTITDSSHVRTPPGDYVLHHVSASATRIGSDVWVGAQATIAAGVTVADGAFVAANAVVTRDVDAGWLVAGNPARAVRQLGYEPAADGAEATDVDG